MGRAGKKLVKAAKEARAMVAAPLLVNPQLLADQIAGLTDFELERLRDRLPHHVRRSLGPSRWERY